MEQIIVNRAGGGILRLLSYKDSYGVTKAEQHIELMGQDVLSISFLSAVTVDFAIGDFIEAFGERYYLNALPQLTKHDDRNFEYELTFEGIQYQLIKAQFLDVDATGYSTGSNFSLMGNLEDFARLIITNLKRLYGASAWELGDITSGTDSRLLTFQSVTCLAALQSLCQEYEQEFYIERTDTNKYKLHIIVSDTVMNPVFRYGRSRGLYQLERQNIDNKNIITRLFAYGSTKNIPADYRGGCPNLKMPVNAVYSDALPYIQNNQAIDKYGVVEASVVFDDIFPQRTGTVSGISPNSPLKFIDVGMPFDLNASQFGQTIYLLPGVAARVHFNTGGLAGYEFDVEDYDHSSRTFTIKEYTDARGMQFPNPSSAAFQIQPGDEYVLLNISLPSSYVTQAENKLLSKAAKYLDENSKPNVQYSLTIDRFFIKQTGTEFKAGDYIHVIDEDLGVNDAIQIKSFIRDMIDEHKYELTLSDKVRRNNASLLAMYGTIQGIQSALKAHAISSATAKNMTTNVVNNNILKVYQNTWDAQW